MDSGHRSAHQASTNIPESSHRTGFREKSERDCNSSSDPGKLYRWQLSHAIEVVAGK